MMPMCDVLFGVPVEEIRNLPPGRILHLPANEFMGYPRGVIYLGAYHTPRLAFIRFACLMDLANIARAARRRLFGDAA